MYHLLMIGIYLGFNQINIFSFISGDAHKPESRTADPDPEI